MSQGPIGLPGPPGGGCLVLLDPLFEVPPGPPGSPRGGPPGPPSSPGGSSSGPPCDSGSQGPPRQLFMWQSGSALDQSSADMNRSVMQLLTAQQAANVQLQLQTMQSQVVQITHTNTFRNMAESTQERNFDHIYASIPIYDGTDKGFLSG